MKAVAPDLRIRLEGVVEALEEEISSLRAQLEDTHPRSLLPTVAVPTSHRDPGLLERVELRATLRREVERRLAARARALGMPAADPERQARWLATEPVRYEHHHVALAFWLRAPLLVTHVLLPCGLVAVGTRFPPLALLGPVLCWLITRHFGWSDVVLTTQRLVLEGDAFPLEGLRRFVRHVPSRRPISRRVELHYADGHVEWAKVKSCPKALRTSLAAVGVTSSEEHTFF